MSFISSLIIGANSALCRNMPIWLAYVNVFIRCLFGIFGLQAGHCLFEMRNKHPCLFSARKDGIANVAQGIGERIQLIVPIPCPPIELAVWTSNISVNGYL